MISSGSTNGGSVRRARNAVTAVFARLTYRRGTPPTATPDQPPTPAHHLPSKRRTRTAALAAGLVLATLAPTATAGAQEPTTPPASEPTVTPTEPAAPTDPDTPTPDTPETTAPETSDTTAPDTSEATAADSTAPEDTTVPPPHGAIEIPATRTASDTASVLSTSPGTSLIRADQSFFAYVGPGENLDVSFTKALVAFGGGATITVRGPGGIVQTCTIAIADPVGASCNFTDLISATPGVWQIDFDAAPGTFALDSFDWTINVQAGAVTIPGRVYTEEYEPSQNDVQLPTDITLYYQSSDGFVYEAIYSDYHGVDSNLQSNATGIALEGTCISGYESYDAIGPFSDEGRLDLTTTQCGPLYKIFFEPPDPAMPDAATLWNGSSTFLTPPVVLPDVSNLQFAQDPTSLIRNGTFTFDVVNHIGNASLQIDANNDGDYDDPEDRIIPQAITADGTYTVPFDGLDGLGNPISLADPITARVLIDQAGEIHFVNYDVENRGGLQVTALNGPDAGSTTLYWNDTQLRTESRMCTTPVLDGRGGVDSTGGVHGWTCPIATSNFNDGVNGSWGDVRYIEDWTYHQIDEQVVLAMPAEVPDLGDAPTSYGTLLADNGPLHYIPGFDPATGTAPLMLGSLIDSEPDGVPSALALADDTTTSDDGDAVASPIVAGPVGSTMTVPVTVTNNTGADAILLGWVDLDGNGVFDAGELRQVTVPSAPGPQVVNLAWDITAPLTAETYSRFRLFPAGLDPALLAPTGPAPAGEVEDHVVSTTVLDKVAVDNVANGDGTYTVTYDLNVTRYGLDGTYDLTDNLRLGTGVSVVSEDIVNTAPGGIATNPAWNGIADQAVLAASPQPIVGGDTHTYRATVVVAIDEEGATFEGTDCESGSAPGGGGVTNTATLAFDGYEVTDDECREYPAVVHTKTVASGPTPIAEGQYRITYDVTVTNKGAAPDEYDLSDTLTFGSSVTVVDTAVLAVDPGSVTANPNWDGQGDPILAQNVAIDAAAGPDAPTVHTYTVQVDFTVAPGITPEGADCELQPGEDGTGLLNTVTVTHNGETQEATACPPPPFTLINKQVQDVERVDDGTTTVTYTIDVLQFGVDAIYDLDDQLHYGTGIRVLSAMVTNTSPGDIPTNDTWDGLSNLRVADDVPIAAGAAHTYQVTVNATGGNGTTTTSTDCDLDDNEDGTGLLNTASVTSNDITITATACNPLEPPSLPRTGASLILWTVIGTTLIATGALAMHLNRRRRQAHTT